MMSLGVEPYPSNVQTVGPLSEMGEHGKTLTPLPEETEGEEKEEALQRLNEEFKGSKHNQIFRFLRDQEELNRRFAQFAMNSDEEESSDESEGVMTEKMSYYTGRGGRKVNAPRRSHSFDSLEQNVSSDDDRSNLNDLDEEIQRTATLKKEKKKQKQKKQLQVKKDIRPQTAMGSRPSGNYSVSYHDETYGPVEPTPPPVYRTVSDPAPPAAPRSSPNCEYGEHYPQAPQIHSPHATSETQVEFDSRNKRITPGTSRASSTSARYSSYGSTSRRPKSVVPTTDHMDYPGYTPRQTRYGHGVSPPTTLDERTRQRLYAEAEGIIERQNQNDAYKKSRRYPSGEASFITRLDCDESTYRRFSKSAQGVRKSSTVNDLNSIKGNARPIKVLKLPPLEGAVINKKVKVHGTGLVGTARGGPVPNVAESLVG